MNFEETGAIRSGALLSLDDIAELASLLPTSAKPRPGLRITDAPRLDDWLRRSKVCECASSLTGRSCNPVRAILFDKITQLNWSLGWHQDRTIAVHECQKVAGFGPWSNKAGIVHVEPPFGVIERMITARIHIDPVYADNAPLLIVEGSHRLGRIAEAQVNAVVSNGPISSCYADVGDVWFYATPILHASEGNRSGRRRRVLQVDFSADVLPSPLSWRGIS